MLFKKIWIFPFFGFFVKLEGLTGPKSFFNSSFPFFLGPKKHQFLWWNFSRSMLSRVGEEKLRDLTEMGGHVICMFSLKENMRYTDSHPFNKGKLDEIGWFLDILTKLLNPLLVLRQCLEKKCIEWYIKLCCVSLSKPGCLHQIVHGVRNSFELPDCRSWCLLPFTTMTCHTRITGRRIVGKERVYKL